MPSTLPVNMQQVMQMGTHTEKLQHTLQVLPNVTAQQVDKEREKNDELKRCQVQDIDPSYLIEETDPQFVSTLWEGNLESEGGRPAGQELKFTYSFTESGTMKASFLDVGSGNTKELDLVVGVGEKKEQTPNEIDIDQFKVE